MCEDFIAEVENYLFFTKDIVPFIVSDTLQ